MEASQRTPKIIGQTPVTEVEIFIWWLLDLFINWMLIGYIMIGILQIYYNHRIILHTTIELPFYKWGHIAESEWVPGSGSSGSWSHISPLLVSIIIIKWGLTSPGFFSGFLLLGPSLISYWWCEETDQPDHKFPKNLVVLNNQKSTGYIGGSHWLYWTSHESGNPPSKEKGGPWSCKEEKAFKSREEVGKKRKFLVKNALFGVRSPS